MMSDSEVSKNSKKAIDKTEEAILPPEYKGKKILCKVWSDIGENSNPHMVGKKEVKYGTPTFNIKIGGKDRLYKINYRQRGYIKREGKRLIYDTHFLNTVGGLSYHEYPEDMDSEETYTVFKNNAVNMYVKKGGIPQWYLLIAMAIAGIALIALMVTVPPAMQAQEEVKFLDQQITALKAENQRLQSGQPDRIGNIP